MGVHRTGSFFISSFSFLAGFCFFACGCTVVVGVLLIKSVVGSSAGKTDTDGMVWLSRCASTPFLSSRGLSFTPAGALTNSSVDCCNPTVWRSTIPGFTSVLAFEAGTVSVLLASPRVGMESMLSVVEKEALALSITTVWISVFSGVTSF